MNAPSSLTFNTTSTKVPISFGTQSNSHNFQWTAKIGLSGFVTALIIFLTYLAYTPRVDKKSPAFTSDTFPFVGSWSFFTRKWTFWKNAVAQSKTGNFSFWLGKYHVVGVSGEAARKVFLDNRDLAFVEGAELVGHGPDFVPPMHEIYNPNLFHNGRSYFQRRLIDLQKTEQLAKRLPRVREDARACFEAMAQDPSGITNPTQACYNLVVKQGCRVVCADEISDNPILLKNLTDTLTELMHTSSLQSVAVPWLPSFSYWKRRYLRYRLSSLLTPIVTKRLNKGSPSTDDALRMFVESGDSKDFIMNFFISILFIATANAGYLSGAMLNIVAHHKEWQGKIYNEIKAAAEAHSRKKGAPLVEQLESIPLEAWDSLSPSADLCYKEAIRMWVAFPMMRLNLSPNPIAIPGTKEVIPGHTFVGYNTTEIHFDEQLYPDPGKYDPGRFSEGREEFKKQAYGFLGWGGGRHPCMGMRWAKIQQNMILAYALAMYEWTGCDSNGQPIDHFDRQTELGMAAPKLPQGLFCKYIARENA